MFRALQVFPVIRKFIILGAASGVWKSVDGGDKWKSIFDDQPISSIGSIAIAPSDPNVIYVGSGEANIRGNVAAGNGIYKSVDGGKTWNHVWKQEGQIGTMIVHPKILISHLLQYLDMHLDRILNVVFIAQKMAEKHGNKF